MDTLVRGWRLLLSVSLAVATLHGVVACGSPGGQKPVGVSDRVSGRSPSIESPDAGVRDGAASLPVNYRSTFTKVNKARFVSSGHASGRWDVDVWANDVARQALASRSRDVPVGAVVVEEHYERTSDGGAGPVMVMEKREKGFSPHHGDWKWTVVGSAGQLVREGFIEQCAGCHDDAPMDGLFPIVE